MPDREKVLMALECLADGQTCACCDYKPYDDCSRRVARDALALLKEQEAEKKCCRDCEYYGACHDE